MLASPHPADPGVGAGTAGRADRAGALGADDVVHVPADRHDLEEERTASREARGLGIGPSVLALQVGQFEGFQAGSSRISSSCSQPCPRILPSERCAQPHLLGGLGNRGCPKCCPILAHPLPVTT